MHTHMENIIPIGNTYRYDTSIGITVNKLNSCFNGHATDILQMHICGLRFKCNTIA